MMNIEQIIEDFSFAEEWEDKYSYLIEIGNNSPDFSEEEKVDSNRVSGCLSRVWVVYEVIEDKYYFRSSSDASIVRGLSTLIAAIFSGKTAEEILETDVNEYFLRMDILVHICPNRRNGLYSMVDLIKSRVVST